MHFDVLAIMMVLPIKHFVVKTLHFTNWRHIDETHKCCCNIAAHFQGIEFCILSSAHADVAVAVATAAVDPDACSGARVSIRIFVCRNVGRFKRTDYVDETTGLHGNIRICVCVCLLTSDICRYVSNYHTMLVAIYSHASPPIVGQNTRPVV